MRKLIFALLLGLGVVCADTASAHSLKVSTARILTGDDDMLRVELGMNAIDANRAMGAGNLADYMLAHLSLFGSDGKSCDHRTPETTPDDDGVKITIDWNCGKVAKPLFYRSTILTDFDVAASQIVLIGAGEDAPQQILSFERTTIDLSAARPSLLSVIGRYVWLGIGHIATGYDHIAFLLAIILWGRKLWPLVKVVTAFTLSHSVTLTLSALGFVHLPETITEPAIAVTIMFVAMLNFLSRDIDRRWIETFFFGFVHGFGFASALAETGLPSHARIPALAAFNVGVEIGQIAVIAIALPLLLGVDRLMARRRGVPGLDQRAPAFVFACSSIILLLGVYWFVARTILGDAA